MNDFEAMIPPGAFLAAFAVLLVAGCILLWRLVQCPSNSLSWIDLVATNGVLNAYKIGYWVGVGFSSWVIVQQTYAGELDSALLVVYLGFLGAVPVGMSAIGSRSIQPDYRNPPALELPPVPEPKPGKEAPLLDKPPKRRRSR